jgi:hypothetical protein
MIMGKKENEDANWDARDSFQFSNGRAISVAGMPGGAPRRGRRAPSQVARQW